ncbi:MAG: NAD(P)H-dependent oxidoreductase [Betaproteobacteria bacterium]|jgi:NAD(P)H-dependent FMN reductase|nr:MAG: NAD(P)H-dependent oxidoreductase [Betaproteobacteria bacterium]
MSVPKLLAFAGSLREASFNRKVVAVAAAGARAAGADVTVIDFRDLSMPIYDGDLEAEHGLPDGAKAFKRLLIEHHGVLVATPEYNSQFPALLKNALDWASRREGDEKPMIAFNDKVAGVMSASPGAQAGLRGQFLLRAQLAYLGMVVVPDRVGVGRAHEAFDEQGAMKDPAQQRLLEELGEKTVHFVQRLLL